MLVLEPASHKKLDLREILDTKHCLAAVELSSDMMRW